MLSSSLKRLFKTHSACCQKALGLSVRMSAYFRCLVALNQASDDEEKHELFKTLTRLAPLTRRYELEADAVEYIQHWIYPVLREMVSTVFF
ncbi:MAG: hypothetical protein H7318_06990 [Oligoflexus sp.]|nr:hypothetical protein [Oligoflexus sp.]